MQNDQLKKYFKLIQLESNKWIFGQVNQNTSVFKDNGEIMFKGPGGTLLTIDSHNTTQKVLGDPTESAYQAPK